jgi:hypothetical protein
MAKKKAAAKKVDTLPKVSSSKKPRVTRKRKDVKDHKVGFELKGKPSNGKDKVGVIIKSVKKTIPQPFDDNYRFLDVELEGFKNPKNPKDTQAPKPSEFDYADGVYKPAVGVQSSYKVITPPAGDGNTLVIGIPKSKKKSNQKDGVVVGDELVITVITQKSFIF